MNKTPLKQRPPRELSTDIVRDVLGAGISFIVEYGLALWAAENEQLHALDFKRVCF